MKVYLIAGEPSGDLLGARLMQAMTEKCVDVQFFGVGGENMALEGLHTLFDIKDLAVMGLAEVIPSIPLVLKRIRQTVEDIVRIQPDVVVTVDSWSFCARVHKALRKRHLGIPQVHYVAPQVWAWKKKRAKTMYKYIDYLLTLFPYEPKYFTPYKLPTTFVGHPVIESSILRGNAVEFKQRYNIDDDSKVMAVLPGSRKTEVARLLPVFLDFVKVFREKHPEFCYVIPTVHTVEEQVRKTVEESGLPIMVVNTEEGRYDAFRATDLAVAASGTVALELAMIDVPHVIAYKVAPLTAWLAKHFLKIQFVNLTNILLGREVVPELLQDDCNVEKIMFYMEEFLKKDSLYEHQQDGFAKVKEVLGMGEQMPSSNACDAILKIINSAKKDKKV